MENGLKETEIFDYDYLKSCIDALAEKKMIFSSEFDFQLELARKLKENYPEKVYLEMFSYDEDKEKKVYTDIVVKIGENEYVAIELKYKIKGASADRKYYEYKGTSGAVKLFPQGAYNLSCIAFLKDVERLEHLVEGKIKLNMSEKKVVRGYSVILTNDSLLYEERSNEDEEAICKEFLIYPRKDKKTIISGERAKWIWVDSEFIKHKGKQSKEKKKNLKQIRMDSKSLEDSKTKAIFDENEDNYPIITLEGEYEIKWNDYKLPEECLNGNPELKYMITEYIKPLERESYVI